VIKPAYSVSFLLSINIFVWQNVLYFPNDPRTSKVTRVCLFMGHLQFLCLVLVYRSYDVPYIGLN